MGREQRAGGLSGPIAPFGVGARGLPAADGASRGKPLHSPDPPP